MAPGGREWQFNHTLAMVTDQRAAFFFQVPAVRFHPAVLAAMALPDLTMATVRSKAAGTTALAWATTVGDGQWETCPTPWHRTVQLSGAAWRALYPDVEPRSGESVEVTFVTCRMPVRPARMERLLSGDQICLHRQDVQRLGITGPVIVNYGGIPGAFRIVKSDDERDRGLVRLSYQSRMLLGVPQRSFGLLPEILLAATAQTARPRGILLAEPTWEGAPGAGWRAARKFGAWLEAGATLLLRAPEVAFRTVDALPGEDHARTVRLAPDLFPLLGMQPGGQVYVAWGPRNRVVATALALADPTGGPSQWAATDRVGHHSPRARAVPPFARLRVGAEIRVALGIPRTAVVTVQRRVSSLILAKLNELILPVTGLFIALSVDAKMSVWEVILAVVAILCLLLVPLRVRRNPRGRAP